MVDRNRRSSGREFRARHLRSRTMPFPDLPPSDRLLSPPFCPSIGAEGWEGNRAKEKGVGPTPSGGDRRARRQTIRRLEVTQRPRDPRFHPPVSGSVPGGPHRSEGQDRAFLFTGKPKKRKIADLSKKSEAAPFLFFLRPLLLFPTFTFSHLNFPKIRRTAPPRPSRQDTPLVRRAERERERASEKNAFLPFFRRRNRTKLVFS